MKQLKIPSLTGQSKNSSPDAISLLMDRMERNPISIMPWPGFNYQPGVSFTIAHCDDCLFLKYYVRENTLKATYTHSNDPVYKDSCVEFFLSFDKTKPYYNFEFNCLGTCLAEFGSAKENRASLPEETIKEIKYKAITTTGNDDEGARVEWELTLIVPLSVFRFHRIISLHGLTCYMNFSKCGDDLPQPHFLSWMPIQSPAPNFHLQEYFGEVKFL